MSASSSPGGAVEGWLYKRGAINTSYQKRYFKLRDQKQLDYYDTFGSLKGVIPLKGSTLIPDKQENEAHGFQIQPVSVSRVYRLKAANLNTWKYWVGAIQRCPGVSVLSRSQISPVEPPSPTVPPQSPPRRASTQQQQQQQRQVPKQPEMQIAPPMSNDEFLKKIKNGADPSPFDKLPNPAIISAARANRLDIVKALVEAKVSVNRQSEKKSSPLTAAGMRGFEDTVRYLIEKKANVNSATTDNDTPLSLAVWKNHVTTALMLMQAKADCSRVDRFGDTVLIDAAKGGSPRLVRALIATKKLKLDHSNNDGLTPLLCAAMNNHQEVAKIFLEAKADPDIPNRDGATALIIAASRGLKDMCSILLAGGANPRIVTQTGVWAGSAAQLNCRTLFAGIQPANTPAVRKQQDPATLIAPPHSDEAFLKMLQDGQEILSDQWRFGENRERPLIRACRANKLHMVKAVIKAKGDPNERNNKGVPPIHAAAMRGFLPIVQFLVKEQKVDVDATNKNGDSALSLACWKNHASTAIFLIDSKANVERVDSFGDTVLLDAAKNGSPSLVEKLVNTGRLSLDHRNRERKTALINAVESPVTTRASEADAVATVKILLDAKANPNEELDDSGLSVLMVAARQGGKDICEALLAARANPNHQNKMGNDVLSVASPQVRNIFLRMRLKRQNSFEIDEERPWKSLTELKEAIEYICSEQNNISLVEPILKECLQHCCAQYLGDLFQTGPDTWDTLSIPKRFKRILQEIVRVAREKSKNFSKDEATKDLVRKLKYENRVTERRMKLEAYKDVIEMAIEDEVLTKKELEMINATRIRHGLSMRDHNLILKQLNVSEQQYSQFTQNKLRLTSDTKQEDQGSDEDLANMMTCVVCLDARSSFVIIPCMHLCLCEGCSPFYLSQQAGTMKCPKCRATVKTVTKVFI